MSLFSRRNAPRPDTYQYQVSESARQRILQSMRICLEQQGSNNLSIGNVLDEMRDKLLQRYGGFRSSSYAAARMSDDPVIEHFFRCPDEEVMDFLQMCFETRWNCGGQPTIGVINKVLEEERIGFQLSPISEVECEATGFLSHFARNRKAYRVVPPTVIRRDEQLMHQGVVQPCLLVLGDSRFANASGELLKAFDEYRKGDYGDAVTDAGAAFETVLKTICTHKKWEYDSQKDTCSALLEICRAKGLFHPFYKQVLEGTATIRNKIGDAHGKGPKPEYTATKELADHMLYTVCNNINLLITLAEL